MRVGMFLFTHPLAPSLRVWRGNSPNKLLRNLFKDRINIYQLFIINS
jgi:hypothetical protein